ncbi:MAG: glutaredoxin 3 [Gammaproteobacteria bacterium]|nr:glutaredoxin 3 [Gammaproteobacteria bacterium]
MAKVLMYSTRHCSYCRMAERLLEKKSAPVEKVLVDENPARREEMVRLTGRTSVPQIFIGETHVGGYMELAGLERSGQLDALLAS